MIHRIVKKLQSTPFDRLEYAYGGLSLYIGSQEVSTNSIDWNGYEKTRKMLTQLQADFEKSGIQEIVINLK